MLSDSLIRIIESRAEELTRGAVKKLQSSPRTPSYHELCYEELYRRVYAVYQDLGGWLEEKTDHAIQAWYSELAEKRFNEGIPLVEVLWGLVLIKYHLRDCIDASGWRIQPWNSVGGKGSIGLLASFSIGLSAIRLMPTSARRPFAERRSDETPERQNRAAGGLCCLTLRATNPPDVLDRAVEERLARHARTC